MVAPSRNRNLLRVAFPSHASNTNDRCDLNRKIAQDRTLCCLEESDYAKK